MSGHDAKLAHRAPRVLANETLAGLCTRRIHRTARAPLRHQQVLLRPQRGDFTARRTGDFTARRPNVPLVRPRVNWTEALGEVLGIVGKVLRRSSHAKGELGTCGQVSESHQRLAVRSNPTGQVYQIYVQSKSATWRISPSPLPAGVFN
jgi:hypothetical protein